MVYLTRPKWVIKPKSWLNLGVILFYSLFRSLMLTASSMEPLCKFVPVCRFGWRISKCKKILQILILQHLRKFICSWEHFSFSKHVYSSLFWPFSNTSFIVFIIVFATVMKKLPSLVVLLLSLVLVISVHFDFASSLSNPKGTHFVDMVCSFQVCL